MKVTLLNVTPNAEEHIVEVARVSSSRKNKKDKPEGLLSYLVRHKHWSPFEHSYATFEIETSKAIGIQLIRHRSFSFQEFSQRYQDVNHMGDMFEPIELRAQCEDNRQSSTEVIDPKFDIMGVVSYPANEAIEKHFESCQTLYNRLLDAGVAREQARSILPLTVYTKVWWTASFQSIMNFIELRDEKTSQVEIQEYARALKEIMLETFTETTKLWGETYWK